MASVRWVIVVAIGCGGGNVDKTPVRPAVPTDAGAPIELDRMVNAGATLEALVPAAGPLAAAPPAASDGPGFTKALQTEMLRHYDQFGNCFAKEPTTSGTVTNAFVIDPSGAISNVYTKSDNNGAMAACMDAVVHTLTFAPSTDHKSTEVNWRWELRPN